MSKPGMQPLKVMTEYNPIQLKEVQVLIKRHNIKTTNGKVQPLDRAVPDPKHICSFVHATGVKPLGKLFENIPTNTVALQQSDYRLSAEQLAKYKARREAAGPNASLSSAAARPKATPSPPAQPRERARSTSCSSEEEYKDRRSRSGDKYKKPDSEPAKSSRRRSPERYSNGSRKYEAKDAPGRLDKHKRDHSATPPTKRSGSYRRRSRSRSTSISPPARRRSRSPSSPRRSATPVRNLSNRPGEFRPDKKRHRDRRSASRSPSPPPSPAPAPTYRSSRRRSRESSPERRRRKHSRSKSHEKRLDAYADAADYPFGVNFFDPMLRPHLRPDMVVRYPYAPMPYYQPPAIPPHFMPPRFFPEPVYYRPRRPLPVYNHRPIPKFVTVTDAPATSSAAGHTDTSSPSVAALLPAADKLDASTTSPA